jgi:hypothetical protein
VRPDQVIAQIRFQLDQLSTLNAHHDFEHLCRHLARARICSNILPASGPVAAGGDQGRDFETFRTYLKAQALNAESTFLGLVSRRPLVFACTAQKKDLAEKVRSDVKTIMGSGSTVEGVHFFFATDVEVALRHKLRDWARTNHGIDLEVHDAQSISELLADREVFWIAEKYLSLAADIFPRVEGVENEAWYEPARERWKAADLANVNFADLCEIRASSRHAALTPAVIQDSSFWVSLLERILECELDDSARRRVAYDLAFVSFKGLGHLQGQEARLREFFEKAGERTDTAELLDSAVLLNYCGWASASGCVALGRKELCKWRDAIVERTEQELRVAAGPNRTCSLLDLRAYLAVSPHPRPPHTLDPDAAIRNWMRLTELVGEARLFPLEQFADRLSQYVDTLGEHPGFDGLTYRVDRLLADRQGGVMAAHKARDRARAFSKAGKTLRALKHLHQAKVNWYTKETLWQSCAAMLNISRWYVRLGLTFAAKHYALAAAYVALDSKDDGVKALVSRALIQAAECDYVQGSWFGFLELTDLGVAMNHALARDPGNADVHVELQRTMFHAGVLAFIAEQLAPQLWEAVQDRVGRLGAAQVAEDWRREWPKGPDSAQVWDQLRESLVMPPFSDAGSEREVSWSALGVRWNLRWTNDYETSPRAEELASLLQVLTADFGDEDLCLLRTSVSVSVSVSDIRTLRCERLPGNAGSEWIVSLPRARSGRKREADFDAFAVAMSVLEEVSLLPDDQFGKLLETRFREGLSNKTFVAAPYAHIYEYFIRKETFAATRRQDFAPLKPAGSFEGYSSPELGWRGDPGPGYSAERAKVQISNRYAGALRLVRHTVERLRRDGTFLDVVRRLRSAGWRDWHILAAVCASAVNFRVASVFPIESDPAAGTKLFQEVMSSPEQVDATPVPDSCFTEDELRFHLEMGMMSTVKVLGLESHQLTPDLKAITDFLAIRYNYWTDDIPHKDPFKPPRSRSRRQRSR